MIDKYYYNDWDNIVFIPTRLWVIGLLRYHTAVIPIKLLKIQSWISDELFKNLTDVYSRTKYS